MFTLDVSTFLLDSCDITFVNGGIANVAPLSARFSDISKPQSTNIKSPSMMYQGHQCWHNMFNKFTTSSAFGNKYNCTCWAYHHQKLGSILIFTVWVCHNCRNGCSSFNKHFKAVNYTGHPEGIRWLKTFKTQFIWSSVDLATLPTPSTLWT